MDEAWEAAATLRQAEGKPSGNLPKGSGMGRLRSLPSVCRPDRGFRTAPDIAVGGRLQPSCVRTGQCLDSASTTAE